MKNLIILPIPIWSFISGVMWIFLASAFMQNCSETDNCLPYEGTVYGASCNGMVVKVNNKDVSSYWETGDDHVENAIGVRIPEKFLQLVDSATSKNLTFYFDFRELQPNEENICPQITADPSRKVFMTEFSFEPCD